MIGKLIGAGFVVLAGAAAGFLKAERARRRVTTLRNLEQLIARILGEILYRGTSMPDLLVELQEEQFCPVLDLQNCSELRRYKLPDLLTVSEKQQLQGFFTGLGRATTEESSQEGLYYQKICAQLLENAQHEAATAEELYTKLGLCCGALAALLLF